MDCRILLGATKELQKQINFTTSPPKLLSGLSKTDYRSLWNTRNTVSFGTPHFGLRSAIFCRTLSCQYGSSRLSRTALAFSDKAFRVVSKKRKGQSAKHKHARWGTNATTSKLTTAEDTAYPMPLARAFAAAFVTALANRGMPMTAATLESAVAAAMPSLQVARAQTGQQPKAAFVPPIAPAYACHLFLLGAHTSLPQVDLLKHLPTDTALDSSPPLTLPKSSRLLAIEPSPPPASSCSRGGK